MSWLMIISAFIYATVAEVCVNDIMESQWMPGTLLEQIGGFQENLTEIQSRDVQNGSAEEAFNLMSFHRSMMNQFLCRNYVTNQIIEVVEPTRISRRTGKLSGKDLLLNDEGSSKYEEWLKKSTTFDDIYNQVKPKSERRNDESKPKSDLDGPDYVLNEPVYDQSYPTSPHPTFMEKTYKSGDKLADIFEIALTALAYLSFGMFVVHLIMSLSLAQYPMTPDPRIVANAAQYLDTYEESSASIDSQEYNYKSSETVPRNFEEASPNELAKSILLIINSSLTAQNDHGKCFLYTLCEAAKISRKVKGKNKLFMSLLSFGVSWLSDSISMKFVSKSSALQANLMGLGLGKCQIYECARYQS